MDSTTAAAMLPSGRPPALANGALVGIDEGCLDTAPFDGMRVAVEGRADGATVGVTDGLSDGACDGALVGLRVGRGEFKGICVGWSVGCPVGCAVSCAYVDGPDPVSLLYVCVENHAGNVPVM